MKRFGLVILSLLAFNLLVGCASDAAATKAATQSQKEINEAKNNDWQD